MATFGHFVSEETKQKIRETLSGRESPKKGCKISDGQKQKISKTLKKHYKRGTLKPYAHWTGKKMSVATREKMSITHKANPNSGRFKKGSKVNLGRIRLDMRGSNNPNWKGGTTTEINKRTSDPKWRELAKQIYERDNWRCQICGEHCRNKILCHHILPVRENGTDNPRNLTTLDRGHHTKIEKSKFQDFWRFYLSKHIKISLN